MKIIGFTCLIKNRDSYTSIYMRIKYQHIHLKHERSRKTEDVDYTTFLNL